MYLIQGHPNSICITFNVSDNESSVGLEENFSLPAVFLMYMVLNETTRDMMNLHQETSGVDNRLEQTTRSQNERQRRD